MLIRKQPFALSNQRPSTGYLVKQGESKVTERPELVQAKAEIKRFN